MMDDPSDKEQYDPSPVEQWGMALNAMSAAQEMDIDVLSKLRPLDLRLRKSSSLEDLINAKLNEQNAALDSDIKSNHDELEPERRSERTARASAAAEKKKATNCHVAALCIGPWEYHSTYEGDLLAKFYYASRKLVWEILDYGLKSKMEIQWSDIADLKATYREDGPDTLEILLSRAPTFFREINPQPKKHTLWQPCSDFTGGHAMAYSRHFLQCKSGSLAKHFEKLIQCDQHLYSLSQQSDILGNLSCEPTLPNFWDQHELNHHVSDCVKNAYEYPVEGFLESPMSCASVPTSSYGYTVEGFLESPLSCASGPTSNGYLVERFLESPLSCASVPTSSYGYKAERFLESPLSCASFPNSSYGYFEGSLESPMSCASVPSFQTDFSRTLLVTQDAHSIVPGFDDKEYEGNFANETNKFISNQEWDELAVPQLQQSISKSDFLLESERQASEEMNMCNLSSVDAAPAGQSLALQEVARQLLSDSHVSKFDERSVMSKVNSFSSLIHGEEDAMTSTHHIGDSDNGRTYEPNPAVGFHASNDGFISMQSTGTLRNLSHTSRRSLGDLMNLPLPNFFEQ